MTFDIDANGILNVTAVDKGTGKEQKITIQAASGLSEAEVEQMRQDADLHAEEDKARRETVELINVADTSAYRAEKLLQEQEDKIDAGLKVEVEGKITAVREALAADPPEAERLRTALDDLNGALMKVGESVYGGEQAAAEGAAGGAAPGAAPGEEGGADEGEEAGTVEGEFREV